MYQLPYYSALFLLLIYFFVFVSPPHQLIDISTNGQAMIQKMEDSSKPVVAAIHGSCLGGGSEVHTYITVSKLSRFNS